MRFEKWHALGNAYLLVMADEAVPLHPERIRRLCDANTGIGSDGVLEVVGHDDRQAEIRIWNPDGSQAEMSGNGTRIAAAWLLRATAATEVEITVAGRRVRATAARDCQVRQSLGEAIVADDLALDVAGERIAVTPVDVGNPHAVVLRDALSRTTSFGSARLSSPTRRSLTVRTSSSPGPSRVTRSQSSCGSAARETSASGSSAAAVAAAAVTRGWCDSPVRIAMPGGALTVSVRGREVTLEGPAERIYVGETDL